MITAPVAALAAALALTPVMIRIARAMHWVAQPTQDRWHRVPTALMGGIAIFAAASLGWAVLPGSAALAAIWLGGALLALAGFADDRWRLSLAAKLVVQLAGAAILISSGLLLMPEWPLWLSIPLTVFWVVGVTNAVNLLDNMDGLAAGVSAIAALTFGVLALGNGDAVIAGAAFVLAAAALGFLAYNYNPAKTFMGDCGSLFLGFTLSGLALAVPLAGTGRGPIALLLVPAAVMAVPIFDTTLVTVKRLLVGRSVGQGGRDHSSHRLVALGLTERGAVLTLYGIAAGFGVIAVALQRTGTGLLLSLLIYATVALAAFGAFLACLRVYDRETEDRGRLRADGRGPADHGLLRAAFRHRHMLTGVCVDTLLVTASSLAAFYPGHEGAPSDPAFAAVTRALPAVVLMKVATFHAFGLHHRMGWWRMGTPQIVRLVAASLTASIAVLVALAVALGPEGVPRAALIIDAVLATVAVTGSRLSFQFFRGFRASLAAPVDGVAGEGGDKRRGWVPGAAPSTWYERAASS